MKTHRQIIDAAGGPQAVHDALGLKDKLFTVRSWQTRGKIPDEHWAAVAASGLATLEELALAAAKRERAA